MSIDVWLYFALAVLAGAVLILLVAKSLHGRLAAAVVLLVVLIFEYLLRPMYVGLSGSFGQSLSQDLSVDRDGFFIAVLVGSIFLLAALIPLESAHRMDGKIFRRRTTTIRRMPWLDFVVGGVAVLMVVSLAILARGTLVVDPGTLALRDEGASGALLQLSIVPIGMVIHLVARAVIGDQGRSTRIAAGMAVCGVAAVHALAFGGRAEIVVLVLACFAIVVWRGKIRFSLKQAVSIGLVAVAFLSVYRVAVREPFFESNAGLPVALVLSQAMGSPVRATLGSGDISAFDRLIELQNSPDVQPPWPGSTYVAVRRWMIRDGGPRPLSMLSGSELFSRSVYPAISRLGGAVGVSAAGEGLMNFGMLGVVMAGIMVGAYCWVADRLARRGVVAVSLAAVMVGRLPGVVRGDFLHVTVLFIPLISGVLASWLLYTASMRSVGERGTAPRFG